ncbi:MAG: WYL domain-containing protein [Muribaculaceae bacterium]|nr:WYL domain-containing protein [Muribaculaceae bacterium]
MARDLFSRYVWILETIKRYGRISREELDNCWRRSQFSEGDPLPRRTFYNYRLAIEELFKITIAYSVSENVYYIEEEDQQDSELTEWLLNSASMTNLLSDSRDVSSKIVLEEVPSARQYLNELVNALKDSHPVTFDYQPYTRTQPNCGINVEPYFLKIFRQRWYLTGRNVRDNVIKTYALDRMSNLTLCTSTYAIPDDFDPKAYFRDSFGIVFNQGEVKNIVIRVEPRQAKYFRALPLHHSQTETVSDSCSFFHYRLKISDDFVQELLSYGPKITVVNPPELRAMMLANLRDSLANYEQK